MYDRPQLGIDQVQAAMDAMLEQATRQPDRPVAIAIVDEQGNILSYAHMDGCRTLPRQLAVRKAYTAAVRTVDSGGLCRVPRERWPGRVGDGRC